MGPGGGLEGQAGVSVRSVERKTLGWRLDTARWLEIYNTYLVEVGSTVLKKSRLVYNNFELDD